MGQSTPFVPPCLSQPELDALCRQMLEASEAMSDEQILSVADALHDTLRSRRPLRHRVHRRVEDRLYAEGGARFPF